MRFPTGNAVDFGDLSQAASAPQGCGSFTRGLNGGGQTPSYASVINTINYGSLGNAIDFGDLTQARRLMTAFSDTQEVVGQVVLNHQLILMLLIL